MASPVSPVGDLDSTAGEGVQKSQGQYEGRRYISPCCIKCVRLVVSMYNRIIRFLVCIFFSCCKTLQMRVKDFMSIKVVKIPRSDNNQTLPPPPEDDDDSPDRGSPIILSPKKETDQSSDDGSEIVTRTTDPVPLLTTPPKKVSPSGSEAGMSEGEIVDRTS